MKKKHIILISHRRSGTHLTLDLIRNNFYDYRLPYISMYYLHEQKNDIRYFSSLKPRLNESSGLRVFKSHSTTNIKDFYNQSECTQKIGKYLLENSKIIYVFRDGRDALVSQYFHERKDKIMSFSEYLKFPNDYYPHTTKQMLSKTQFWAYHVSSWLSCKKEILYIRFEDILLSYDKVVDAIEKFLNSKSTKHLIDIRLDKNKDEIPFRRNNSTFESDKIIYTTVNYRNGKIGDYTNYFSKADLDYFDQVVKDYNLTNLQWGQ